MSIVPFALSGLMDYSVLLLLLKLGFSLHGRPLHRAMLLQSQVPGTPGCLLLICGCAQCSNFCTQPEFAYNTFQFRLFSEVAENLFLFSFSVQNLLTSSILKMPVSEDDDSFHKTVAVPRNRQLASPLQVIIL